jgi:hypothetical protein
MNFDGVLRFGFVFLHFCERLHLHKYVGYFVFMHTCISLNEYYIDFFPKLDDKCFKRQWLVSVLNGHVLKTNSELFGFLCIITGLLMKGFSVA